MHVLNILFEPGGQISWLNIIILLLVLAGGYFWGRGKTPARLRAKQAEIQSWQQKTHDAETELKRYAGGHDAEFRKQQEAVLDMTERVKSLEGDIRAMASDKQQLIKQLAEKEAGLRDYAKQAAAQDDRFKGLQAENSQEMEKLKAELSQTRSDIQQARQWEPQARNAQREAAEARQAFADLQRKTLEFDLRIKSASEYAARVQPLEAELAGVKQELQALRDKSAADKNQLILLSAELNQARSALEAARAGEMALQQAVTEGKKEWDRLKAELDQEKQQSLNLKNAGNLELERLRNQIQMLERQLSETSHQQSGTSPTDPAIAGLPPDAAQPQKGGSDGQVIVDNQPGQGEES